MLLNITNKMERIIKPVAAFFDWISWFFMGVMVLLTVAQVLLRKLFSSSILGTIEMTELMMIVIVFLAFAQTELDDGHIRIDILMKNLSKRVRKSVDVVTQFICSVIFGIMTYAAFIYALDVMESGEVTMDLRIPIYPLDFVIVIGFAAMTCVLILKTLKSVCEVINHES